MSALVRVAISSVADLLTTISDHVTGADIVRADKTNSERSLQRVHARIANVRNGFQAIRSRSEAMTERVAEFRRQRASL